MSNTAYGNAIATIKIFIDDNFGSSSVTGRAIYEEHAAVVMCADNKARVYPTTFNPTRFVGLLATTLTITQFDRAAGWVMAAVYTTGCASIKLDAQEATFYDTITLGVRGFEVVKSTSRLKQTGLAVGTVVGFATKSSQATPIININVRDTPEDATDTAAPFSAPSLLAATPPATSAAMGKKSEPKMSFEEFNKAAKKKRKPKKKK